MLARIVPRFVISGVIQNAYYANYMAVEMSKQIIGDDLELFMHYDSKKYFECNFFGHLASLARPSQFANQFEAEKYDEAVSKFAVYNDVKKIFEHLNEFTLEIKELFKVVEANNTSSNFFSRGEVDETTAEDISETLTKYHTLLKKLEPYPEWHSKVVEEVGKWFHLMHNNMAESPIKRNLFEKLNRQEYFV